MQNKLGVRLLNIQSIPVYLKPSWFVLMTVVIGGYGLYLGQFPRISYGAAFTVSATIALFVALGVFIHEFAHALMGIFRGLRVEYISMTLWGGVTKLSPGSPLSSLLVSLAGPIINAVYALVLFMAAGMLPPSPLATGVEVAAQANLLISAFNLIPSYPLDGGHSLEAVITAVSKRRYTGAHITAWIGLLIIPILISFAFYQGIWRTTAGLLLILIICWYLWSASYPVLKALAHQADGNDPLSAAHLTQPALLLPEVATVGDLQQAWDGIAPVLLTRSGIPVGWVAAENAAILIQTEPPDSPISTMLAPLAPGSIDMAAYRIDIMDYFNGYRYSLLPQDMKQGYLPIAWLVTRQGTPTGIITHQVIAAQLSREQHRQLR